MKRTILLFVMIISMLAAKAQVNIPYQEIRYNVHYHWGLVKMHIASGVVTLHSDDSRDFTATLNGNSVPWEGRVLCVSDTLRASMTNSGGLSRENISYINGWYRKPTSNEFNSTAYNPDSSDNYKNIKGAGSLDASPSTMEAIDVTANMLGLFYTFHEIDFEKLTDGEQITIPIDVAGGGTEKVVITYKGKSEYVIDGVTYPVYDTIFEYSYQGRMSGYPVDCRVGTNDRIPLYFSASLPVGHVEMIYNP